MFIKDTVYGPVMCIKYPEDGPVMCIKYRIHHSVLLGLIVYLFYSKI